MSESRHDNVICLGCGCVCDDIRVTVAAKRITGLTNVCTLGESWFGDGVLPATTRVGSAAASLDEALDAAATLLFAASGRLLIYIAGDVTCETHREAAALADRIGATIDGPTADTVSDGILAAQRRGRASATFGELRHRADAIIFWGVDPQVRYPRFMERFLLAEASLAQARRLIAVDIGSDRGPAECHERISLNPALDVDALSVMRAVVEQRRLGELPDAYKAAGELARRMTRDFQYIAIIFDAEPNRERRDASRPEALIALTQSLNKPTRAALFALRAGGNLNGLESVLTWQTGYPFAVDFGGGSPRYRGLETTADRIARRRYESALVIGSPGTIPTAVSEQLASIPTVALGPRASEASFTPRVTIDTGTASIHESGLVFRMDDVPLSCRAVLFHPRSAVEVVQQLARRVPESTEVA